MNIKFYENPYGMFFYIDQYLFRVRSSSSDPYEYLLEYHSTRQDSFVYIGKTIHDYEHHTRVYIQKIAQTEFINFINQRGYLRYE